MKSNDEKLLHALGFLRVALLALALLNILFPLIEILIPSSQAADRHNLWFLLTTIISPVMAPLLIVVMLFDYIMSRVRAADAEGALRRRYVTISRIELCVIGITLLFWVPFLSSKLS